MATPPRRWFRFSLRTLFVLVTLAACVFGWAGYHVSWIRQRHAFAARQPNQLFPLKFTLNKYQPPARWPLRLLGEAGVGTVLVSDEDEHEQGYALFPEAHIERLPQP